MGLSIPQARVPVVDRQGLLEAPKGAVILLLGFVHGGLPRPCFYAVRGNPEGPVECVQRIVRLFLAGVGFRLPYPCLRVLRCELQELLVVVRVVGSQRGDLPIGSDRVLVLPRRRGGVSSIRPEGRDVGGGLQSPFERGERILGLPSVQLDEPQDLQHVGVSAVKRDPFLGRAPGGQGV